MHPSGRCCLLLLMLLSTPIRPGLFLAAAGLACSRSDAQPGPRVAAGRDPAAPVPAVAADPTVAASSRVVLLVSHPTSRVLRDLQALIDAGLLSVPGLEIHAVFAADELAAYRRTELAVRRVGWSDVLVERLRCRIEEDEVFGYNACTETFRRLFVESSGAIFPGGSDLQPALYDAPTQLLTRVRTPARHRFEVSFLYHLLGRSRHRHWVPMIGRRPGYPVLGLCLGVQTLNVALGGSLHQDLPSALYGVHTAEAVLRLPPAQQHRNYRNHRDPERWPEPWIRHSVRLNESWRARVGGALAGNVIAVYSNHHQGIDRLALDLEVLATSLDGRVVEAAAHRTYRNVIGVQFHPEYPDWHAREREQRPRVRPGSAGEDPMSPGFGPSLTPTGHAIHARLWQVFADGLVTHD